MSPASRPTPDPVSPIVSARWLLTAPPNVRIVDVRWSLKASGAAAYAAGHVPSAVFLDLDRDLSAPSGPGRHPLPQRAALERALRAAGIDDETHVVAYDDAVGSVAARVVFLLRRHGHARVSLVDGGWPALLAAGLKPTTEVAAHAPGTIRLAEARGDDVVDKAYVEALIARGDGLLLDARAVERYRGETEPVDARPGHIPTAKSAPFSANLEAAPDGSSVFRSPAELERHYAALGARRDREIVVYCGSGVTACHDLLALERAGFSAKVYEGSYGDWARDPRLPVGLGDE